jgi:Gpi18-like mannosyltransferase
MKNLNHLYVYVSLLIFTVIYILLPTGCHEGDTSCWIAWSKYVFNNGLGNIYNSTSDYLPLYHYFLKLYAKICGSKELIVSNIHYLKLYSLFFHIITGYFLVLWLKKVNDNDYVIIFKSLFFLLNIGILYNGIVWGQVDSILAGLLFISCYFSIKKNILLALIFYVLSINFKLHAIVYFPLLGLLLLPMMIKNFSVKNVFKWIGIPITLQLFILTPFIISGTFDKLLEVVFGSVDRFSVVSCNAFNIWEFLIIEKTDLMELSDQITFAGLSYKNWGLLMFVTTSAIALFPLGKETFYSIFQRKEFKFSSNDFILICAIIPLVFFYFNTQMHERYSHPGIVFLAAYAIKTHKLKYLYLGSIAYFLNLEKVLMFLNLQTYDTFIFNRMFISFLFLALILFLFYELYKKKSKNESEDDLIKF